MALTTLSLSHEIIPRVCAEATAIFQKRYKEWQVWDIRRNMSSIKFDQEHDVVYFSHEFARNVNHQLLHEFALQFPAQTKQIRTLALPAVFFSGAKEGMDVLRSLRYFEHLTELVIVLGYSAGQGLAGNIPGMQSSALWAALWAESSERGHQNWVFPDAVDCSLEYLKQDYWPDWKIPRVSVVTFLDEVLNVMNGSGTFKSLFKNDTA